MLVAIVTARLPAVMEAPNIAGAFIEVLIALASVAPVLLGAGKLSVDASLLGDRPNTSAQSPRRSSAASAGYGRRSRFHASIRVCV